MTNQEAISVLESINAKTDYFLINDDARAEAIDMAISALQAQDVPYTNVGDTISRQVAIDALVKAIREDPYYDSNEAINGLGVCDVRVILNDLPSAQPENIRCYECKHGTHSGCGNVYICHVSPELVMKHTGNFYCGYAKRKTDEEVN